VGLKRRVFLQQAALTLAAFGLSDSGFSLLADRYQQALAQPIRRKLALLVGINQYPEQVGDSSSETLLDALSIPLRDRSLARGSMLLGCLTDVELQRELLLSRFGFQPNDVLCLTDQQATRQAIEQAFITHLTEQARPGDIVVFHFSGLGSRVKLAVASESRNTEPRNTLVPVDGMLPTEESPAVNDLMEETLELLLRSLLTDQITTILDVGYSDLGKAFQGNLRIRSRPNAPTGQVNVAELALQQQLLSRIKGSDRIQPSRLFPGVVLTAAKLGQVATEAQWSGFSAGLFTYALTQQLWRSAPATTLNISLGRAGVAVEQQIGEQQPQIGGQQGQDQLLPAYFLRPGSSGADGVITTVEADGKTAQIWLAGLSANLLEHYDAASLLMQSSAASASDAASPLLQIRSRTGLRAIARLVNSEPASLQAGQTVQEAVRVLSSDIRLTIALDSSLERIERVDATSAFAAISHVSTIAVGEQPADYLFGKAQSLAPTIALSLPIEPPAGVSLPKEELTPSKSSYGLFQLGRVAISNPLIDGEAVKTAVNRLMPQLQMLLAAKLLRLTENSGSSRLGVRATLETVAPQHRIVVTQQETVRAPWMPLPQRKISESVESAAIATLPLGSQVQYRLENYSDRPVYFVVIGFDGNGNAIAFYPNPQVPTDQNQASFDQGDHLISPGKTLTLPQSDSPNSEWVLRGAAGLAETHLIFSRAPLTQTFAALTEMGHLDNRYPVKTLSRPLEVAQAVMQDLHQASNSGSTVSSMAASTAAYALDVNCWATLSFAYRLEDV
jgi:hypothetical protein